MTLAPSPQTLLDFCVGSNLFEAGAQPFADFLLERPETWTVALVAVTIADIPHQGHTASQPTVAVWMGNHNGVWPLRARLMAPLDETLTAVAQARAANEDYFNNLYFFRYYRPTNNTGEFDVSLRAFYEDDPTALMRNTNEMQSLLINAKRVPGTIFA